MRVTWRKARAVTMVGAGMLLAACDGGTGPPDPPSVPGEVVATATGSASIVLAWMASGGAVESFEVERSSGGGAFQPLDTVPAGQTELVDTGLEPSTLYRYRIRACNEGGCSAFAPAASATTFAELRVTTTQLPVAVVGRPYSRGLNASGGGGEYVWELVAGTLPAGLSLSPAGIVSGTPESEEVATFTVQVTSTVGVAETSTRQLTLEVVVAEPVVVGTVALPPALDGATYEVVLKVEGGTGTFVWFVDSGSLPAGLTLEPEGVIVGEPEEVGVFEVGLSVVSGPESEVVEFELRVVADDETTWNGTTFTLSEVPDAILPALAGAVELWEEVLVGDLPAGFIPPGTFLPGECFGFGEALNGTSVDDMVVVLDISPIDGPGQILGQAAPCLLRDGSALPGVGVLTLDSDDLLPLTGTEQLTDLIFHEIGHTLGFGSLWNPFLQGGGTITPSFTGPGAVAEWMALGGTGNVPVEGAAGPGTNDSHWRESVFGTEVMTGFLNAGGNPLSRVTIASMADLGYTVDFSVAEPFVLPSQPAVAAGRALGWDVVPRVTPKILRW